MYFFEVKDDEREFVRKKYPEAIISSDVFSEKNKEKVKDAEILCVMVHSDLSAKNLSSLKNLKLIITRSTGYDHIDLAYCREHNILVSHVPDYGSYVIAEHVFALLLSSVRKILEGEKKTAEHIFKEDGLRGMALKGKTIGIIGLGKIGAHVARIASRGFLMRVIAYDLHPREDLARDYGFHYLETLDELYRESDIITLHLPLLPSTRHLINQESIAKMKDGVVLINTSRGGIIQTFDLVEAIKAGKFSHVALDVVEHEDNITEVSELLDLPNVIITPHIAYYTRESVEKMYAISSEIIDSFLRNGEVPSQYIVLGD